MKNIIRFCALGMFALFCALHLACAGTSQTAKASGQTAGVQLTGDIASPAPTVAAPTETHADDNVPRIKPEQAIQLVKEGKAIVVDTRDESSYKNMRVKGAKNIPYSEFQAGKHPSLPKDKQLIFYCT